LVAVEVPPSPKVQLDETKVPDPVDVLLNEAEVPLLV
jgi:hypothetical protein